MSKKRKKPANQTATIARKYRVTARTVRNWKTEGAPISNPGKLSAWLATRRQAPRGGSFPPVSTPAQNPTDAKPPLVGTEHTLSRLESEEAAAWSMMTEAVATGDALQIRLKRDAWLQISKDLLRFDIQIAADKRATKEIVPRAEVEAALRQLGFVLKFSFKGFENIAPLVCGMKTALEVWQILRKPVEEVLVVAIAGLRAAEPKVPGWIIDALANSTEHFPGEAERSKAIAELLRLAVANEAARARQLFDLRTAAEAKWRTMTDAAERTAFWHSTLAPLLVGQLPAQPTESSATLSEPTAPQAPEQKTQGQN
jgi:hypothetical protein